jgi:Bifunctional DNA primase/polymerase, N-terminal
VSRLHAALAAAAQGWPVFPLRPGQKRPRAELTAWEARASFDPNRIKGWWRRHPTDNVAIATGPAGLVVVDLDLARPDEPRPADHPHARGGLDVFNALAARHADPVPGGTWTVETASGGRHLYYRAPQQSGPWRNTAGRIGWHIDTRGAGGYVVAAGSVVGGRPYTLIHDQPPAPLPLWIADLLAPPATPPAPAESKEAPKGRGYGSAALAGEVARVLEAPEGQRNAALNRAAWNLARHIARGHLARHVVEDALHATGVAAGGQTPAGVAATVRSAIDARLGRGATR